MVVLSGLDAVREALVYHSEDTADRPPMRVYEPPGFRPPSQGKRTMGADRGLAGTGPAVTQAPAGPRGGRIGDVQCREEVASLEGLQVEEGVGAKCLSGTREDEGGACPRRGGPRARGSRDRMSGWAGRRRTESVWARQGAGQDVP